VSACQITLSSGCIVDEDGRVICLIGVGKGIV
jgi:hypothetical protein